MSSRQISVAERHSLITKGFSDRDPFLKGIVVRHLCDKLTVVLRIRDKLAVVFVEALNFDSDTFSVALSTNNSLLSKRHEGKGN